MQMAKKYPPKNSVYALVIALVARWLVKESGTDWQDFWVYHDSVWSIPENKRIKVHIEFEDYSHGQSQV